MLRQAASQATPSFHLQINRHHNTTIELAGNWRAGAHAQPDTLQTLLQTIQPTDLDSAHWDLTGITEIDHIALSLLWQTWQHKKPPHLQLNPAQAQQIEQFIEQQHISEKKETTCHEKIKQRLLDLFLSPIIILGQLVLNLITHTKDLIILLGQCILDCLALIRHPRKLPLKEISATVFKTGAQALGITALVGFLIGIVLSYLSSQQLKQFGANTLIVNLLGISITRELGPVLAAILIAGRSGSSITAQLGVMRVTEEIDAMRVMGISVSQRLIFPKLIAMTFVMPLLAAWVSTIALVGGAIAANLELNLPISFFLKKLQQVVNMPHIWIGLFKSLVFGTSIALIACHFGLRIKPNTESLGQGTTQSVVTAITAVILLDALFAILFKSIS